MTTFPQPDALLASIIRTSDDAVYSKNKEGKITSWNEAAEKLYGYTRDEAIGKPASMLIPSHRKGEEDIILKRVISGEEIGHYETERLVKDGQLINVSLSLSPIVEDGVVVGISAISRDISSLQELKDIRARLAAIVDSTDDAIYSKDNSGKITSWNRAAEKLYGYQAIEIIGKPVSILIPENHQGEEFVILEDIFSGRKVDHYQTERRRKDGTLINVSLTISPVKDRDGKIIEASIIARDITELVERKAKEQMMRLQDQFIAVASHELRTPLTSIQGFSMTLQDRWDDYTEEQKKEFMKIISDQSKRLGDLVNDLLTVSKMAHGKLKKDLQAYDLSTLIPQTLREMDAEHIEFDVPEKLCVRVDKNHFKQIMVNLLENAIRYGQKDISIEAYEVTDQWVEVRVCDCGPGVQESFIPKLFEKFSQESDSPVEGTGLGLAIVKDLVENQGGKIWYEPNVPQGSCFAFRLIQA